MYSEERLEDLSPESSDDGGTSFPTTTASSLVCLNVYDLVEQNHWLYPAGLGIYHSGVQIYGLELAYGGHPYESPGIFATAPRCAPGTVRWRESIEIGHTRLTRTEVRQLIGDMGRQYRGNVYNLLQLNCNTFAEDLCLRLTGRGVPGWVNRMANVAITLHCLLPAGWVPPLRPPSGDPFAPIASADDDHEAAQSLLSPQAKGREGALNGGESLNDGRAGGFAVLVPSAASAQVSASR
jgi:deubiquitinase DESI2